jgi:acetyltransferase-like isoleucine patch superfamily enzyme
LDYLQLFGAGKIAQTVSYYCLKWQLFNINGYWVDSGFMPDTQYLSHPVQEFDGKQHQQAKFFLALGYQDLNNLRASKLKQLNAIGIETVSIINPDIQGDIETGCNCLVIPGCEHIEPFVRLGNNVFIWNNASISHFVTIDDDCWISNGVIIGGSSHIGQGSFIGLGSIVNHGINIGKNCLIGSGAIISKDLPDNSVILPNASKLSAMTSDRAKVFLQ